MKPIKLLTTTFLASALLAGAAQANPLILIPALTIKHGIEKTQQFNADVSAIRAGYMPKKIADSGAANDRDLRAIRDKFGAGRNDIVIYRGHANNYSGSTNLRGVKSTNSAAVLTVSNTWDAGGNYTLRQTGDRQIQVIQADGGGHTVNTDQTGSRAILSANITGNNHTLNAAQHGNWNSAFVSQSDYNNTANLLQQGDGNHLIINQEGVMNEANLQQVGNSNVATAFQSATIGGPLGNKTVIRQNGNNNNALTNSVGRNNTTNITQNGSGNHVAMDDPTRSEHRYSDLPRLAHYADKYGFAGNHLGVEGVGIKTNITQTGEGQTALLSLKGDNHNVTLDQRGGRDSGNIALIGVKGSLNTVDLQQGGNRHVSSVRIDGTSNTYIGKQLRNQYESAVMIGGNNHRVSVNQGSLSDESGSLTDLALMGDGHNVDVTQNASNSVIKGRVFGERNTLVAKQTGAENRMEVNTGVVTSNNTMDLTQAGSNNSMQIDLTGTASGNTITANQTQNNSEFALNVSGNRNTISFDNGVNGSYHVPESGMTHAW